MSFEIDVAHVQMYAANVIHLAQQAPSKLRGAVRVKEGVVGKSAHFERIGPTEAVKRTSRHADTPLVSTPHSRRRVSLEDWEWADLVDKEDEVRVLIDPTSEYTINAAKAMNRTIDKLIIPAMFGDAYSVDSSDSVSTVALPAAQKVVHGGTNMTVAKLRAAKRILDDADVEDEDRYIVISPAALEKLLTDSQITSSDFNTVKALVQGDLNTFMGFTFIKSTLLPKTGNIRKCFAWHKNGVALAIGRDINHKVSVRDDKGYATQVYFCLTMGATRVEEARVVEIEIDETA